MMLLVDLTTLFCVTHRRPLDVIPHWHSMWGPFDKMTHQPLTN